MTGLINLLPWRVQRLKRRAVRWTALFATGLAGIALACGGWHWHITQQITLVRSTPLSPQQLKALRDDNIQQRKRLEAIAVLHQQRLDVLRHQHILSRWSQRLTQLAAQLPDAVWFTALRFDAGRLEIAGKSLTAEALSEWADALKTLPGVGVVHQGATVRDAQAAWRFNWTLVMVEPDDAPTH